MIPTIIEEVKTLSTSINEKMPLLIFGGEETSKDHPWIKKILSADLFHSKDFGVICNEVVKPLLGEPVNRQKLEQIEAKYGKDTFRDLVGAVAFCYSRSGKRNLTPEELAMDLEAIGVQQQKVKVLKTVWGKCRDEVLKNLKSSQLLPSLRDVSWSIDRRLANDRIYEVLENTIILGFRVQKGENVNEFYVELSPAEFMGFLEEMKEIEKLLKKKDLWGF